MSFLPNRSPAFFATVGILVSLLGASPCHLTAEEFAKGLRPLISKHPPIPAALIQEIDTRVAEALAQGKLPGCVIAIGRKDGIFYQKAFGARALLPEREPMTPTTIFDLASLTKPIVTTTLLLVLADQGKLDLDDPVVRYLPAFGKNGKQAMTLRHLLTHVSGLPSETPVRDYENGRTEALRRIYALRPQAAPATKFIYSDVGFLVLEEVIRHITGQDLAALAATYIFQPLNLRDTGFLPTKSPRIAPTEMRAGSWMRGDVHDPRAFRLGGVAGHAGLFSTASDLARYARMLLGRGSLDGTRILSTRQVANMFAPHDVPGGIRALGWDVQSIYSVNRGMALSRRAVGHGGYTGTSLWIDPEKNLFIIFLSNRVHPEGRGAVNPLVSAIATLVGQSLGGSPTPTLGPAKPLAVGIDALAAQNFAPLRGLRFALLTNDGARNRDGVRTSDVLASQKDLHLVALLSPEHGLTTQREGRITDGKDAKTGLPIFSLYGGSRGPRTPHPQGPRPVTLPGDIDAVVVDLPDMGVRFFTYASTLHAVLRAAASQELQVILLDRPNPINGIDVSGPMLNPSLLSAVNHHPLPIRHGMTLGELAELMTADEHLGLSLHIIRMPDYPREKYYDELGLEWVPPSPNLQTFHQALLYPGVALVEGTNVSVGRGTPHPFEVLGAPWLDGQKLAQALNQAGLPGIAFESTQFTPNANPFAGKVCQGVRVSITDRRTFDPIKMGLALATILRRLFPHTWDPTRLEKMIGDPTVTRAMLSPKSVPDISGLYQNDLAAFQAKRQKYLLYPNAR